MNFKKIERSEFSPQYSVPGYWLLLFGSGFAKRDWLLNILYWIFSFLTFFRFVPSGQKIAYYDNSIKLFNFGLPSSVFRLFLAL